MSVRLALAFFLLSAAAFLAVVPVASAGPVPDCQSQAVGVGSLTLAVVTYGADCGVAVQPYTCDEVWYGGHGIGGFIITCSPGLRGPCLWPVCRP
jgi:hypothetical protein